jgi:DNA-directed RNA polymerase subunit B'
MIESITGKVVAVTGDSSLGIDEQRFDISNKVHIRRMGSILKEHGFNSSGKERFMDGRTGKMMEGLVFVGVVDYLRLVHLASKKAHARSIGPRDCLTRQAKDGTTEDIDNCTLMCIAISTGRRLGGGLRFGEVCLIIWCIVSVYMSDIVYNM